MMHKLFHFPTIDKEKLGDHDFIKGLPRFSDQYWENNQQLAVAFFELASAKNCTPVQLALAWVLARGENIIPIPGTKQRKYLEENAGSADISLNETDRNEIESLVNRFPNIGPRYNDNLSRLAGK